MISLFDAHQTAAELIAQGQTRCGAVQFLKISEHFSNTSQREPAAAYAFLSFLSDQSLEEAKKALSTLSNIKEEKLKKIYSNDGFICSGNMISHEKPYTISKNRHRFDVVVENFGRIEYFTRSMNNLEKFRPDVDRLIIFDCSRNPQEEFNKLMENFEELSKRFKNIVFLRRRNWGLNHGAQFDYLRMIFDGKISAPSWVWFMQEHYLNPREGVKGDTIPDGKSLDLDLVEFLLAGSSKRMVFCSRNGWRISATVPSVYDAVGALDNIASMPHDEYGQLLESIDISLVVDGGNFGIDPMIFQNNYMESGHFYSNGVGDYGHSHVFETFLSKVPNDEGASFYDMSYFKEFSNCQAVKEFFRDQIGKPVPYFYNMRHWYQIHGRNVHDYGLHFDKNLINYALLCSEMLRTVNTDKKITCAIGEEILNFN